MTNQRRKAAVAAYKEKKAVAGIFALRARDGACWVGSAPNVETIGNRFRFSLEMGRHPNRTLQDAWTKDGGLRFEVLERLDDDVPELSRVRVLNERLDVWLAKLGAHPL